MVSSWGIIPFFKFLRRVNYDNLPRSWLMMCEKGTRSTTIPRRFKEIPPLTARRCWYFCFCPCESLSLRVVMRYHEPLGFDFLGFRKILNWAILSLSCFYVAGHFARNGADKKTSCPIWCDDPMTAGASLTVRPPVSHNAFNVGSDHGQDRNLPSSV